MSTWPSGDGEMARRIRAFDWSGTPLGALDSWRPDLRATVQLVLNSGLPMMFAWGDELIQIYNDALIPLAGEKHPAMLGAALGATWPETLEINGPVYARALSGETVVVEDMRMTLARYGLADEAWFTGSFSPWQDESGAIAGVVVTVQESTVSVLADKVRETESRYRTLFDAIDQGFCVIEVLFDDEQRVTDYRLLQANPAFERQTGMTDAVGRNMRDLAPDHEQHWFDIYGEIALTGEPRRFEREAAALGRWYEVYAFRVDEPGLRRVGILFNDIGDRRRAEEALLASNQLLRATFDSSLQIVQLFGAVRDENGEIVDFEWLLTNRQWDERWGPMAGKRLLQENPAVVRSGVWDRFIEVMRTGDPITHEHYYPYEQFDGWFLQTVARANDGILLSTLDITDRRRAEAALRESEQRLRQFGEASQDVLWIRDAASLQWEYLTPAFEDIYGLTRHEALSGDNYRSWLDLIVPEDRASAKAAIERVRAGEQVTFDYRIRRPSDGAIRWLRDTDFPMRGEDGRVVRIGGIGKDITQIQETRQRLEASEERLGSAVEVGRLGLWDWNVVTGELHWSDEHFRMEGYSVGEVTPSYEAWASRIHPDDRAATEQALRQAMDSREDYVREFRVVHPDGAVRWLSGRGRFFYSKDGHPLRMVGAMIDTTERREWEELQQMLVAELQHRTRNLIAVVRSMAEKTARSSSDLPDFSQRFRDRLDAMARVQGLLSRLNEHDRVTFDDLLETELAVVGGVSSRLSTVGPAGVRLRSSTVQILAMAIHELTTNAMKYGALAQDTDGRLSVKWTLDADGPDGKPWLHIDWRESGVIMPVEGAMPTGTGEGRELIERALPYQLGARTTYDLGTDGIHCTISLPVSDTTRLPENTEADADQGGKRTRT